MPKSARRCLVRDADTDAIRLHWLLAANGEAMLQANARQRLWFFSSFYSSPTITDKTMQAMPYIAHSIRLNRNQRYLMMRGTR